MGIGICALKKVSTWLSNQQYDRYIKHIEKVGGTPYSNLKSLILLELGDEEKAHMIRMNVIFAFTIYAFTVAAIFLMV